MSKPERNDWNPEGRRLYENVKEFILGGKATFTLLGAQTGQRFTYKVIKPKPEMPHFVRVLTGPDNTRDFVYLGTIFNSQEYQPGRRSSISPSAPSSLAFIWAWGVISRDQLPEHLEVWHEGRCGKCGRKLTVPESIERGIGPECWRKSK